MLYLPRGWWHIAEAMDEPSLHLTITVVPARGVDVLHWILERAQGHLEVRMDVPRLADAETQKVYAANLREAFLEAFDDEALGCFFQEWDKRNHVRPRLSLPSGVERRPVARSSKEE